MTVRTIVKHPSEILTTPTKKVTKFDRNLSSLLKDMYDTMLDADGIGIAAPQVGESISVAIVDLGEGDDIIEMINPEVLQVEGAVVEVEGCLSFPELYGEVERPFFVRIKAQERDGSWYELEAEDYEARAILHEIDHLDGILFDSKILRVVDPSELEADEEDKI
ncbi:peptide deformylase [Paenisporosarcina sp. TG20]|uniref:peptide deformylase n=1 Tax=Paenisporosarcina sp. TG20 TaxID=1211706 RepID=UPI0002F1157E|nr:peptide deformylase [Paenisporosarcina sp. TG20]